MFSCFIISNIYSADSENSKIFLCFDVKHRYLDNTFEEPINIKFKLKVNDKYIDDCWKKYLNDSICEFFKLKDFKYIFADDY